MTETDDGNAFGYAPEIWRLFRNAPNAGAFPDGTPGVVSAEAGTPAARSVLRLALRFDGARVIDGRFQAYGCPASIAVGAWIAGWASGRHVDDLRLLKAAHLREALEIPEDRAHCALLGEDALRAVLSRYQEHQA
ncbi:MAG: iron-sulfur cluster assembly scaffold protein [Gammaproteobacteria bacterium]|nr:iron-sulfur cluster assembly scaffold protein [Gammaproteobacteria bacterium]